MNVAVLQVDWHSERPSPSVRMHAKSRPSLRMVENVVRTMIWSTSFMTVISRCQSMSSVIGSNAGRVVGTAGRLTRERPIVNC